MDNFFFKWNYTTFYFLILEFHTIPILPSNPYPILSVNKLQIPTYIYFHTYQYSHTYLLIRANANFFTSEKLLAYKCIGSTIKSITNHIIVLPTQSDCHSGHMAACDARGGAYHTTPTEKRLKR